MAFITAHVVRWAIRCSRNARIWFVIEFHVALAPISSGDPKANLGFLLRDIQPRTAGLNHGHALFSHLTRTPAVSVVGRAGRFNKSDARARWHQSTVPVDALRHHAELQARRHHRVRRDRPQSTWPVSISVRATNKSNQRSILSPTTAPQ